MAEPVRLQLTTEILVPPSIAAVGQTIVVEEVDASGRPIKWKAVDPAASGKGDPGDSITIVDWSADDDYTTVVFSDGSVIQIQAGVGIRNIRDRGTDKYGGNVYDVELTNGMSYEITAPAGADGVGIERIKLSEETDKGNTYTVYLTDGSYYDITAPAGPAGKGLENNATAGQFAVADGKGGITWMTLTNVAEEGA